MDKKTVFVKTEKGEAESNGQSDTLFGDAKRIFHLIDDESTVAEITKRAPPSLRDTLNAVLQELDDGGYIRDMRAPAKAPAKPALKMSTPAFKMSTPKAAAAPVIPSGAVVSKPAAGTAPSSMPDMSDAIKASSNVKKEAGNNTDKGSDLDFSFITSAGKQSNPDADQKTQKEQAEALERSKQEAGRLKAAQAAQLEAAVKAAKQKAEQEAQVEAAAKAAREQAEQAAQAEAAAKAKAAKEKAYEEAKRKAEIEVAARAKVEAAAREKKQAEEAKLKAEQAAEKARAEAEAAKERIEAEVRARLEAEAKIKREAEAQRIKAEQEAEAKRIKAEQEAERLRQELEAAKAKAEAELRNRLEAEARAKAEVEARLKREAEAERLKLEKERAELEVARIKAEAELKMREEAELRIKAEIEARDQKQEKSADEPKASYSPKEDKLDSTAKLRQSFVESFGQKKKNQDATTGSFKLEQFSLIDTGAVSAYAGDAIASPPGGASTGNDAASEESKAREAAAAQEKAKREAARLKEQQELQAKQEQVAKAEQEAARVKAEQEAYRLKVQQEEEQARIAAETQKLADEQSRQWGDAQQRSEALAQAEKERREKEAADAKLKAGKKASRGPRKPLPVGKIGIGLFALILLGLFVMPYVLPFDEYIAPLEKEISAQIKQPVQIKKLQAFLLPLPKIVLHSVSVGKGQELKVEDVEINFDVSALFAQTKSISKLDLLNVTLAGATLDKVIPWIQAAGGIEKYPVARMEFGKLNIKTDDVRLPSLNGTAEFDAQGKLSNAVLKSDDAKLSLEMKLLQDSLHLELNVQESSLPIYRNIKFNDLSVTALIKNGEAVFSDFFAHIHGGTITGKGSLNWSNGWKLQAKLNGRNIEMQKIFPGDAISGELLGETNISLSGATVSLMEKDSLLEGSFEVKNGEIAKVDVETISRFGAKAGVAGHTNFTELSGTFKTDSRGLHIYMSKLATVAANSSGVIDIDAERQLSGKLQVDIKGVGNGNVPLRLSGTTNEPILQAGR